MRHGVIAGIAAIALALAIGALVANWEGTPGYGTAETAQDAMHEGRAATATDPEGVPPAKP